MGQKPAGAHCVKFDVGRIVITPAASSALQANGQAVENLLCRHQAGDWGDVSAQARLVNERGLIERFNLQSVYLLATGERLVVMTNADRSVTMVHLDARGR